MKKFTWGTGIFLFLVLFLAGSAVFIIFASRQTVNLVHKDYYEKGVDYSEEIRVKERSKEFLDALDIQTTNESLLVNIAPEVAAKIDSGSMYLYRPSDSKSDITLSLEAPTSQVSFLKSELKNGRYILKFSWYTKGVKYQIQRPVNVQ
ncbi:FixH family protein [Maribellus sp. CM-23]|uniref:FixH family protein n=1 Tax=Maribellus sp. CM-23 TaxID=2781026 RepID=UPI001F1EA135|nr:FixH family protein [Maribellus sp. CM-23]MCE4563595.1 FixH family protein [Maribellus sp. CM-23]